MAAPAEDARMGRGYVARTAAAVAIYCIFVSLIPVYTKRIFSGKLGFKKFPYPMATAFMQLALAAALLLLTNVATHLACRRGASEGGSWVFGPNFGYKVRGCMLPGLAFGCKYAITNWGIHLVDNGTHVLLGATDLIWVMLLARVFNKEKPGILEILAAAICLAGAFTIAADKAKEVGHAAVLPIFINLLAPFTGAVCLSTLRESVKALFDPEGRLQGTMTKVEFTAFKLAWSCFAAFITCMVLENGVIHLPKAAEAAWWTALAAYPAEGTALVLASSALIFGFHVNLAWLATLCNVLGLGILSEVKVVPQWLLNGVFGLKVQISAMSLLGAALGLLGSATYATASYFTSTRGRLMLRSSGFKWEPVEEPAQDPNKVAPRVVEVGMEARLVHQDRP